MTLEFILSLLATLTSLGCTLLLLRGYRQSGLRLLGWSTLCFVFLTANNVLLFFDMVVFPLVDLRPYRVATSLIGVLFLLYGFVWETQ